MSAYVLAFLIGVIVGLRSMTGPAAVSWAQPESARGSHHTCGERGVVRGGAGDRGRRPIALLENAIAIGGAFLIVSRFR